MDLDVALARHLDAGEDEEGAEHVDHPVELLEERGAGGDEDRPEHEGAEDAPEKDAIVGRGSGTAKYEKMRAKMKMLSTDRLFSMR